MTVKKIQRSNQCQYGNVKLVGRVVNIDTGLYFLKFAIALTDDYSTEKILLRSEIEKNADILLNCGALISDYKNFYEWFCKNETKLPINFSHSNLGWGYLNETEIFKSDSAFPVISSYDGYFDIKQKGSFEQWKAIVQRYAMPQTALQLAVVLGLSAVTVGFLREHLDSSLFVHLYGNSSKGKTTFAILALSTAGNPNPSVQNTLFGTYSDTYNFRINMLAGNYGFPIVFDELSTAYKKDHTDFIYNIANGREKGRLDTSIKKKNVATWATTVISTGESSILTQTNNNQGLYVRVLELTPDKITASADSAEKLKQGVSENYGFANIKYAEYLLNNKEKVLRIFESLREKFLKVDINSDLINRLSKNLSIILTTAILAKNTLNLDFNIDAIKDLLLESLLKQNERLPFNIKDRIVEFLLSDIASNINNYQIVEKNGEIISSSNKKIVGIIKQLKVSTTVNDSTCDVEIIYIPRNFSELLKSGGFTDEKTVIDALKSCGYLLSEGNHNKVKRIVNGAKIRAYVLRFPGNLLNQNICSKYNFY